MKRALAFGFILALCVAGAGAATAQTEPPAATVEDTLFAASNLDPAVRAMFPGATRAWSVPLPGAFQTARVADGDAALVLSKGEDRWYVTRLDAKGGKIWEIERPASQRNPQLSVSDDGTLACLFYTERREVKSEARNEVLGAKGELLWFENAREPYHLSPSGRRVMASWPFRLYDRDRGAVPRPADLPPPPYISESRYLAGDLLLAHESERTKTAELYLVDEAAGRVLWKHRLTWPFDTWDAAAWSPASAQMKVAVRAEATPDEMVEPAIVCLDAAGKEVWERRGKVAERRPGIAFSQDGRELAVYKPHEVYATGAGQSLTLLDASTGATRAVVHTIPAGGGGWRGFLSPIGTFDPVGTRRYLLSSADGSDLVPARTLLAELTEDGAHARVIRFDGFVLPFGGPGGGGTFLAAAQGDHTVSGWSWRP